MPFTFLHAADLHLGSPFKGLSSRDEALARRFSEASRKAFSELIERAIAENVAFVLIAGDVYDGEWKDMSIGHFFNREVAKLARVGIPVFLIKGNHDAASEVTKTLPLPESVHVFPENRAETRYIESLRVAIHGRSFASRSVTENLSRSYPPVEPGFLNIGMLHTSLAGNPAHETYAPCSIDDLARHGYDYWALGHIHQFEIVGTEPHIVYPGNLQGRSVRECGPKGAVFVDVDETGITGVRRVIVDQARFAEITVDITDLASESDVTNQLRDSFVQLSDLAENRLIAVRVRLKGSAPVHPSLIARRAQLTEDVQSLLHHVYEDAWLEKLVIDSREPDELIGPDFGASSLDIAALFAELEHDPEMRKVGEQLLQDIGNAWPSLQEFVAAGLTEELNQLLEEARTLVLARGSGAIAPVTGRE